MKSTMVKETTLPFAALLLLFFVSTGSSVHMVAKKTTSWHNKARYACTTWLYVYLNLSNKFERKSAGAIQIYILIICKYYLRYILLITVSLKINKLINK